MKQTSSRRSRPGPARPRNGEFRFEPRALVKAAQQAVREALLQHKRAGNPVVGTDRKGRIVVVPPKRIDV